MVYIHIPFCRSFCTYCSFYSVIPEGGFSPFAEAVATEIAQRREELAEASKKESDTLYIGGGTPSVLPLSALSRIVGALQKACPSLAPGRVGEFTVEVNPDDVVRLGMDYVSGLADLGVNRVSMGVQSLDDAVLGWMNRRHSSVQARQAYRILREAGIGNISIDLIFGFDPSGITGVGEDLWSRTLDEALDIAGDGSLPCHISAYQLSVEPDSALWQMVRDHRYSEASAEACAQQYDLLCSRLRQAGYRHYEISNFALPGFEARHNSAYWDHVPYVGLGPAAHSFSCAGGVRRRSWNASDVAAYLRAAQTGEWAETVSGEVLTDEQWREEEIMLGLRTERGVAESVILSGGKEAEAAYCALLASGALTRLPGGMVRIPENRFFVSDDIISDLFC